MSGTAWRGGFFQLLRRWWRCRPRPTGSGATDSPSLRWRGGSLAGSLSSISASGGRSPKKRRHVTPRGVMPRSRARVECDCCTRCAGGCRRSIALDNRTAVDHASARCAPSSDRRGHCRYAVDGDWRGADHTGPGESCRARGTTAIPTCDVAPSSTWSGQFSSPVVGPRRFRRRGLGGCLTHSVLAGDDDRRQGSIGASRRGGADLPDGVWISVSAVISPLLVQGDRFALAALLPIAATGSYAAAQEVATKLAFFSIALQPVLFAAASAAYGADLRRIRRLERQALLATAAVMAVRASCWRSMRDHCCNGGWAERSIRNLLECFPGWWAPSSSTRLPRSRMRSCRPAGEPGGGVAAPRELPVFVAALLIVVPRWGMMGAAAVWGARMLVDGAAMWWLSARRA